MDESDLSTWRATVIERAINTEWIASAIICQHYVAQIRLPFLLEVLYDEQCSFSLKRRVLEKIVEHPDLAGRIRDFNRLGTIRNYFAHCGQEVYEIASGRGYVPDPRKPDTGIDFPALYAEFLEVAPRVESFLLSVLKGKGGQMTDTPPRPFLTES
jgi:hypothetical protein